MIRRRFARSAPGAQTSVPSTMIWPEVGVSRRLMQRSRVDLPVPEGPMMLITSPASMSAFTPLRGTTSDDSLVCQHAHDEGFVASKFLINNQDEDISREAADLISDRYQLSKGNQMAQTEEELKVAYLTRLLLDYKNAIIEEEMKECNADLTRPEVKSDIELTLKTMRRIKELGDIQRQLAKMLGDRVVK